MLHPSDLVQGAILSSMFILNFHCIGKPKRVMDDGEADFTVEPQQFVEILDAVSGRTDVQLTFDDGNRSDVAEVLPELQRRGLRAQFFICSGRFGMPEFLDHHDVRELRRAGMSLGSHGMDHVPWRRLEQPGIEREIFQAKQALEQVLEVPIDTAACPFGAYDRRALTALRAAGFRRVYTSDGGRASSNDWLTARNTVRRDDSAESIERLLNASTAAVPLVPRVKRWIKRWR